jgi:surfeit locus 1 family protein
MTRLPEGGGSEYARAAATAASPTRKWVLLAGGLAVTVLVSVFVSLGLWQWRKFEAKTTLQAELDARSRSAVVDMPAAPVNAESLRYRHVRLRGSFEPDRQIFIDNRVHREQAGYHVVTPLRLAGSNMRVLVNRGWIPAGADHRVVPVVETPAGMVELNGIAVVPATRFFTLAPPLAGWQPVWQNLDLGAYSAAAPWPMQSVVVQLDADSPHGFAREWPRPDERAEMHRSYALQWFGFALSSVAIWLWFVFRKS